MVCETFSHGSSLVHRLDGRLRLLAAAVLTIAAALVTRPEALAAALAAGIALAALARIPAGPLSRRLRSLNLFMLLLVLLLPWTAGGPALFRLGPASYGREGFSQALAIAVKANAIVLMLTALLSTLEPMDLGKAMSDLSVPRGLIHLYFFTVRYVDMLHHEYERLRRAMRVRCFRPGMNGHTYRSLGYLVGMLLVKSFDRSERIVAAMKCRGFQGRFVVVHRFAFGALDAAFAATAAAILALMGYLQWR